MLLRAGYKTVMARVRMVAPKIAKVKIRLTRRAPPRISPESTPTFWAKSLIWGTRSA